MHRRCHDLWLAQSQVVIATGLLTSTIALTVLGERRRGIAIVVAFAGLISIGRMVTVNFILDSDFKWLLLAFSLPWPVALVLDRVDR